jgi:hypothetical protein
MPCQFGDAIEGATRKRLSLAPNAIVYEFVSDGRCYCHANEKSSSTFVRLHVSAGL